MLHRQKKTLRGRRDTGLSLVGGALRGANKRKKRKKKKDGTTASAFTSCRFFRAPLVELNENKA